MATAPARTHCLLVPLGTEPRCAEHSIKQTSDWVSGSPRIQDTREWALSASPYVIHGCCNQSAECRTSFSLHPRAMHRTCVHVGLGISTALLKTSGKEGLGREASLSGLC